MEVFGLLLWLVIVNILFQGMLAGRSVNANRMRQIGLIEKKNGSRVITMIHRQDTQRIVGVPTAKMINLEDAQTVIEGIQSTPKDRPIDLILHTPGGMVLAAMQIARAVKAHPGKVTVYVPIYAMSGGTLIALAADEIVVGEYSVLGPVDPQLGGVPAASFLAAREAKSINEVGDLTLVIADVSEKAINQMKTGITELLRDRMGEEKAVALATKMATGTWTHDYAITASEAKELGLPVRVGMPDEVLKLMTLYPQPIQKTSSVEYLPTRELPRLFGSTE